jgi:hypothetical protein
LVPIGGELMAQRNTDPFLLFVEIARAALVEQREHGKAAAAAAAAADAARQSELADLERARALDEAARERDAHLDALRAESMARKARKARTAGRERAAAASAAPPAGWRAATMGEAFAAPRGRALLIGENDRGVWITVRDWTTPRECSAIVNECDRATGDDVFAIRWLLPTGGN